MLVNDRFVSLPEVEEITGLSDVTLWRREKSGEFPARRKISAGRIAWRHSDIMNWMDERPIVGPSVSIGPPINTPA